MAYEQQRAVYQRCAAVCMVAGEQQNSQCTLMHLRLQPQVQVPCVYVPVPTPLCPVLRKHASLPSVKRRTNAHLPADTADASRLDVQCHGITAAGLVHRAAAVGERAA